MATEIILPQLGNSATDVTIERYYKQVGDQVAPGDPLVVVRNARFEWDVPVTAAGTISDILAQPGATVAIGAALIRLNGLAEESTPAAPSAEVVAAAAPANSEITRVTPVARKIAAVHRLDLSAARGSGPGGRITRVDVLALMGQPTTKTDKAFDSCFSLNIPTEATITMPRSAEIAAPAADHATASQPRDAAPQQLPLTDLQRSIAIELVQRKTTIPHALTAVEVELSQVLAVIEARQSRLAKRGIELGLTACIAHAAVAALLKHRLLNSVWSDNGLIVRGRVRLGVATGQNADSWFRLIPDAADLSLQGLARAIGSRQPRSESDDHMSAATFTVCDQGGTRWRHAIVPAAQGAILTIGGIERRPYVLQGQTNDTIVIRPLTILTLTYDARCVSQPQADAFLVDLKSRVEHFTPL